MAILVGLADSQRRNNCALRPLMYSRPGLHCYTLEVETQCSLLVLCVVGCNLKEHSPKYGFYNS